MLARRRRKISGRYRELLAIPYDDLVAMGQSVARGAQLVPPEIGIGYEGPRDCDGRGAPIKFSVMPPWFLNLAVLFRIAELAADHFQGHREGDGREQFRTRFLNRLGVWRDDLPPSRATIKLWRDLWRDHEAEIDDAIADLCRSMHAP